jgi:small-conductance mechanosensitive channel
MAKKLITQRDNFRIKNYWELRRTNPFWIPGWYPNSGGHALNTVFKYIALGIGFLIALNILGINLRFLLVFAGAIGIGVGLGLQNMAANLISGFTIIFGGKIRKGDWVEVETMMGEVTDIYLQATKVRNAFVFCLALYFLHK